MSKEIEKIIKKVQSDSDKRLKKALKQHTGVLIEEFQHRVSVIGEQYSDIQKTLDSHSNQIANVSMDIMEIKSSVRDIRLDIKLDLDKKVDKKHFVDLEGRVRVLEKK